MAVLLPFTIKSGIRQEKEITFMRIVKEDIKLSLFWGYIIVYIGRKSR